MTHRESRGSHTVGISVAPTEEVIVTTQTVSAQEKALDSAIHMLFCGNQNSGERW